MFQTPQHGRRVLTCAFVAAVVAMFFAVPRTRIYAQDTAPGGFVESDASTAARPLYTAAQVQGFVPARGRFLFPAPYSTQGIRLTNASDCAGGSDCVNGIGYSYWRNINNHAGSDTMLIVLGLMRTRGGAGPTLFTYNKVTGETKNAGPLFPDSSNYSWATAEGWYFSATAPTMLYLNDGPKLLRYDVVSKTLSTVFDATTAFGANRYIWQMHSSNDDRVHSFTLRDSTSYAMLGCGVYLEATHTFKLFDAMQDFDECQVDKSGRYVVIKENVDGRNGEDNLIQDLQAGTSSVLLDENGAAGHSDEGVGYLVAEDNFASKPGSVRVWTLGQAPTDGSQGRLVFHATDWAFGSNHIAHANSRADLTLSQQHVCSSSANRLNLPRSNEVLCYRLDGSLQTLVVAPVLTDMNATGGGSDDYWKLPKGEIDVTGEYFIWTSNLMGGRLDAMIVHIPVAKLPPPADGAPIPTSPTSPTPTSPTPTSPTPTDPVPTSPSGPTAPALAEPIAWTSLVKTSVTGDTLAKKAGCDGCADAGAISTQRIAGDGYVELAAPTTSSLQFIGLSKNNPGTSGEEIDFALRFQSGRVEVREDGAYRADAPVVSGDLLRVQVSGGVVQYMKNGTAFYTSKVAPTLPLLVDTALYSKKAVFTSAKIATSAAAPPTTPTTPTSVMSAATWTGLVNTVVAAGGGLTKVAGCDGCPDAGAVSQQRLANGSGYVEFKGDAGFYFLGLDTATTARPGTELPYALRLRDGIAEVRENGVYRADTRFTSTDVLRITAGNGQVTYSKNDVTFWTSAMSTSTALGVTASIYSMNATVVAPLIVSQ